MGKQIDAAFVELPKKERYAEQRAVTARELQQIRQSLSDSSVCFYPFGGADGYHPVLLSNARVSILTGAEPWGNVKGIPRALNLKKCEWALTGMSINFAFDSLGDWNTYASTFGCNDGTLGPLSLARAVTAQILNGDDVRSIHVCAFELSEDGGIYFSRAKGGNADNDHVAFWLTNAAGRSRVFLYTRLRVDTPEARGQISGLHALLSRIGGRREVLQLQKAIPPNLFQSEETRRLLSPDARIIKAIVCDGQRDGSDTAQPIFMRGATLEQEAIPLRDVPDSLGPQFGYGQTVFLHRPVVSSRDA
ncbi:hypothetical protein DIE08_27630 [Burkholderia sp. Bp9004]|nr:hypothetical protein DIE08_27630 [Burkholderia sp. Bp9004]